MVRKQVAAAVKSARKNAVPAAVAARNAVNKHIAGFISKRHKPEINMRKTRLLFVLSAVVLVAGCSHLEGTFVSIARYEKSGDKFYEILPGEAAFEWLPKLLKDLTPFDAADADKKKVLADKYNAYLKEVRANQSKDGGPTRGDELVQKYFDVSLVFANYAENKIAWRDCYLFADEGIVRVLIEIKKDKPSTLGYYQPAPGLRSLIETLFTPEAQERYKKYSE